MKALIRLSAYFASILVLAAALLFTYAFYGSRMFQSQEFDLLHFGGVSFPLAILYLYLVRAMLIGSWSLSPSSNDSEDSAD